MVHKWSLWVMTIILSVILFRCVVTLIKSRYAWRQDVLLYCSTWRTCTRACMTCSTKWVPILYYTLSCNGCYLFSITLCLVVTVMWTLDYKLIVSNVVYMKTSSKCSSLLPWSSGLLSLCRLILIAEKDTVYEKFPIPLINRLEKHFVLTRTVLLSWQERVLDTLIEWVQRFSRVGR